MTELTQHKLLDAYATYDGYSIRCTCGRTWDWHADGPLNLDEVAAGAHYHVSHNNQQIRAEEQAKKIGAPEERDRIAAEVELLYYEWQNATPDNRPDPYEALDMIRVIVYGPREIK